MKHRHRADQPGCPRTRLAEGALAAVDTCECGMLQLHIGALTLRMAPCALSELVGTLTEAVEAHAARIAESGGLSTDPKVSRHQQGDA